ncbi:MAG: MBL fold metallo-hydrolase, partial [Candidatus Fimimonas sp.]
MKIQYLGHSCFRLISEMNTAIICDPYQSEMVGFAMPKVSCDVVTISHHHRDHDCIEEVWGNPAV